MNTPRWMPGAFALLLASCEPTTDEAAPLAAPSIQPTASASASAAPPTASAAPATPPSDPPWVSAVGDPCTGEVAACSKDRKEVLSCKNGKFVRSAVCIASDPCHLNEVLEQIACIPEPGTLAP